MEFLIDRGSSVGQGLAAAQPGDAVHLSEAEGRGYDPTLLATRPLLAFATGSGLATINPLVEHLEAQGDIPRDGLFLFYGEDQRKNIVWPQRLERWRAGGIHVHLAHKDHPQGWRYLQDALAAAAPPLERAHAVMGGSPAMIRAVATALLKGGLSAQRLMLNI